MSRTIFYRKSRESGKKLASTFYTISLLYVYTTLVLLLAYRPKLTLCSLFRREFSRWFVPCPCWYPYYNICRISTPICSRVSRWDILASFKKTRASSISPPLFVNLSNWSCISCNLLSSSVGSKSSSKSVGSDPTRKWYAVCKREISRHIQVKTPSNMWLVHFEETFQQESIEGGGWWKRGKVINFRDREEGGLNQI